jgi:N-sulfoglucosamine sulfohydrolase
MHRRTFLATSLSALAQTPTRRPNIVLLVADDLGLSLGSYGDRNARTPNLDQLAREGVRFTNAFATTASCSPSRSTMLTGLYNHTNGQYGLAQGDHNFHLKAGVTPFARLAKDAGYRTAVIGKFHVNPPGAFDWDVRQEGDAFDVDSMNERVRKFVGSGNQAPFYLHAGFGDPHRGPDSRFAVDRKTSFDPNEIKVPSFLADTPAAREDLAEYYEAVRRLDRGVGLIVETLKAAGQLENTLLVFISDNGMPFPNAKTNLYDSGIHLPMIARGPGLPAGKTCAAMTNWADLVPAFLDFAGIAKAAGLPGRSWRRAAAEENPAGWDRVFLTHTFHGVNMFYPIRGVRTRRYKYLNNLNPELEFLHATDLANSPAWQGRNPKLPMGRRQLRDYLRRPAEELYDLDADPDEIVNLAASPGSREILETLRQQVLGWRMQTKDPWLGVMDRQR